MGKYNFLNHTAIEIEYYFYIRMNRLTIGQKLTKQLKNCAEKEKIIKRLLLAGAFLMLKGGRNYEI